MRPVKARGVLHPHAIGTVFSLERRSPPPDLARFVEVHWRVSWDLRGREPYRSQVLPHPCVHLVFEPGGAAVHGISRRRFERLLEGTGWALGTKFLPAGIEPFTRLAVRELTDRVLGLGEVFGDAGARLERACPPQLGPDHALARVHRFLRDRIPSAPDPRRELTEEVLADMRQAAPGERVADVAVRHHVSERTLQRLFSAYVGIGPKWVLQRYRLHEAVEQLQAQREVDWARLALELGYYDQAHFTRDFRSLVGRTPAQYDADRTAPIRASAAGGGASIS
jgi:AraC-like DNA-binding protein